MRSPLQETARRRGLPEPASEGRGDAEPFALAPRARAALLRATFVAAWAGDGVLSERLAAEHEAALARLEAAGRLPVGPFRDVEVRRQAETLRHWLHGLLAALGAERRQRLVRVRLGGVLGEEAGDALCEQLLPALELELPGEVPTRARLGGRLALLFEDRRASVTLCTSARLRPEDLVLDGFLAHVVLAAADPGGVPARRALRVVPERRARPVRPVELAPLDSARARAYLAALVSDLLAGASCLFPLEAALAYQLEQARGAGSSRPLVERIRWLRDGPRPRGGFASGPLTRLGELPLPPSEDEALALLERRLGLFCALRGTP